MDSAEVLQIGREAIWVLLKISLPLMLTALVIGLIIALFQALTQIQEMTLTFVPKIIAVFVTLLIALPYIIETLRIFANSLSARIVGIS